MNKIISVIIIGILLVASFFIGYSIKEVSSDSSEIKNLQEQITSLQNQNNQLQQQINEPQNIPSPVLEKYDELEPQYKRSLGASINLCTKNNERIYTVSGSGGFTGVTFYYTEDGDEIGSSYFTDEIDDNNPPPKPPINIQEYECTIIKESE